MASAWKAKRLGLTNLHGIQWRQVRVGRPIEPVAVIRLVEDARAGDEVVLTRRDMRFLVFGMEYAGADVTSRPRPR